jgi:Serine carboxypeptidase S28
LTFDQALEDFVQFANNFTLPAGSIGASKASSSDALRPSNIPWIVVGASYPGVRAAVLRVRNPDVVFVSWASSAPVEAQVNMPSYYEAVERSLPRNCSADWVAVTKYVDDILHGTNITSQQQVKYELYKAHLSGPGGNTTLVGNVTPQTLSIDPMTAASFLLDPTYLFQVSDKRRVLTCMFAKVLST